MNQLEVQSSQFPVDHRDTTLLLKSWTLAENRRNSPILFIHDLGEDLSKYENVCALFAQAGYNTYSYNLRGHGLPHQKKDALPIHARVKTHVRDLLQICAWVRHQEGHKNPIIVTSGIGAVIVADFCQRYDSMVDRLVLCAPTLQLKNKPSRIGQFMLDILSEVRPSQVVPYSFCPALEPKPRFKINAGFTMELLHLIPRTTPRLTQGQLATLILCPDQDDRSDYEQILRLANSPRYTHLTAIEMSQYSRHIFSQQAQPAVDAIVEWLASTSASPVEQNSLNLHTQSSILNS